MKSMKRVDIKSRAVLKGQGPKMLPGYYKYWKKHDTCSIMSSQSGVGLIEVFMVYTKFFWEKIKDLSRTKVIFSRTSFPQ